MIRAIESESTSFISSLLRVYWHLAYGVACSNALLAVAFLFWATESCARTPRVRNAIDRLCTKYLMRL